MAADRTDKDKAPPKIRVSTETMKEENEVATWERIETGRGEMIEVGTEMIEVVQEGTMEVANEAMIEAEFEGIGATGAGIKETTEEDSAAEVEREGTIEARATDITQIVGKEINEATGEREAGIEDAANFEITTRRDGQRWINRWKM